MPLQGLRWIVRVNLLLAYPQLNASSRNSLEIASVKSQCLSAVESLKAWTMPPAYSIKMVKAVSGLELLEDALRSKRGVIVLLPHQSTWEIMNAWVNQYAQPTIMYKPSRNKVINQFILKARESSKSKLVPTNAAGVIAIYKDLKKGGLTVILPDHVPENSGNIVAPFFGIPTESITLAGKLAQKSGSVVLGAFCLRRSDQDGFDIYIEPVSNEIYSSELSTSVAAVNQLTEKIIARDPAQYMWGYRRFKSTPQLQGIYRWSEAKIVQVRNQLP